MILDRRPPAITDAGVDECVREHNILYSLQVMENRIIVVCVQVQPVVGYEYVPMIKYHHSIVYTTLGFAYRPIHMFVYTTDCAKQGSPVSA